MKKVLIILLSCFSIVYAQTGKKITLKAGLSSSAVTGIVNDSMSLINLQKVTDTGYTTTNPLYTKNKVITGDSTTSRWLIGYGSSLTYQLGNSFIISDTSTWIHKVARSLGFLPVNLGIPSQTTQQYTPGDNSLYTNATSFLNYNSVPSGSVVVIEGMVNDLKGDTTKYVTGTYETHLAAIIDTLFAKGWPASQIKLFNPSYYYRAPGGVIGNTNYRHSIYNTSTQTVATAKGVGFFDAWSDWYTAYTTNNSMLYSDSVHMTPSGSTVAANLLTDYLSANGVTTYDYNTVRNINYGGATTYGTDSIKGLLVGKEAYFSDVNVVGNSHLSSLTIGSDLSSWKTGTAGLSKFNRLGGLSYSNNKGDYSNFTLLAGYSTSTQNIINYGGFLSPSIYLPYYSATNHRWFTTTASTTTASPVQAMEIYPSGNMQLGGTSFSDASAKLNIQGTISTSTTTNRGVYQQNLLTPTVNNATQYGYDFASTFSAGTGVLTNTLTNGGAGYADGVFTSVALTNITGTGSGAIATLTVSGGVVTVVTMTTYGTGYAVSNTLSAAPSFDGVGSGSGLVITVATLGYPGTIHIAAAFRNAPISLISISAPTNLSNGMLWQASNHLNARLNGVTYQLDQPTVVGTITTGTWNGTAVAAGFGGTGQASYTAGDLLTATGTTTLSKLAKGTANQILGMNNGATTQEYKTINVANGVSITHAANSLTFGLGAITPTTGTFSGSVTLNGGLAANATGFKHKRVTTGSVAGGATALVTITWTNAFADANYTVTADVLEATAAVASMSVVHIESVTASAVTVRVVNNAAGSLTGTINVIAVHD